MPNISSLTMPDGIVYSIKDSIARKDIEEIKKNGSGGNGSSGSGNNFVVTAEYDDSVDGWKADKTFSEIVNAFNSGKNVILINNGEYIYNLSVFSNNILKFVNINMDEIVFANMLSDETFDVRIKRMSLMDA